MWTAKTLVPFITHPGQNCFCPSQWGFGSISNYQRHCVDPQGHWQDEKRCRCEEVPFFSINMLFIGRACLFGGTAASLPSPKTSLTQAESWLGICGSEPRHLFHCWNLFSDSYRRFPFLYLQNPVWFSNLDLFQFESVIYWSLTAARPY